MTSGHRRDALRRGLAWRTRLLTILAIACSRPGGDAPRAPAQSASSRPSAESLAAGIDRALPALRRDTATVGLSAEGTLLTASYAGDTLRRLRAEYLGETGRVVETFYFDTALVFMTRTTLHYDAPMSGRVADSSSAHYDLSDISPPLADSLRALARSLLARISKR